MDRKTRRIWAGLVSYANGTATLASVRATIADCMGWVSFTLISDVFDREFMIEDLSQESETYRPHVERLLRFLCSEPKSVERRSLGERALAFLNEHAGHIRGLVFKEAFFKQEHFQNLNFAPDEIEGFKKRIKSIFGLARYKTYYRGESTLVGEDFLPLGIHIPSKGYKDIADPICDFLASEYEKYLNREVSRRDKKAVPLVPIIVCPYCQKLLMPKRIGRRQYCQQCSDLARTAKYRQKASPDENRDYVWLYRLKHLDSSTRKVKLRQSKVKQRLAEIKSRQGNSSRCQSLLQDLRL